jgi:hypothetical protein
MDRKQLKATSNAKYIDIQVNVQALDSAIQGDSAHMERIAKFENAQR